MSNIKTVSIKKETDDVLKEVSNETGISQSRLTDDALVSFLKKTFPEKFKVKEETKKKN